MPSNPGYGDDAAMARDDLAQISGIGSRTAERLYAAGIRTYAELGSCSADDIVRAVRGVAHPSPAQLDSWRDRARELTATEPAAVPESPADRQREESFMVGVLVNDDGSIRRMTAQHVGKGKGAKGRWAGLERDAQREALFGFIETAISAPAAAAKTPTEQPSDQGQQAEATCAAVVPPRVEYQPAAAPGAAIEARPGRLASSAVLSIERTALRAAEPFTMMMTVDLAEPVRQADRLAYRAVIVARPLAGGSKQTVARSNGLLATTSPTISMAAAGLPAGAYRLDGAISLCKPGSDQPADLAGLAEGLLVQVLPG